MTLLLSEAVAVGANDVSTRLAVGGVTNLLSLIATAGAKVVSTRVATAGVTVVFEPLLATTGKALRGASDRELKPNMT